VSVGLLIRLALPFDHGEVGSLAVGPHEEFPASFLESPANLKALTRDPPTSLTGEIFDSRPNKRQRTEGPDDNMQTLQPSKP